MTVEEAISVIKSNWPDSRYSMLREALTMAIEALAKNDPKDQTVSTVTKCPTCNSEVDVHVDGDTHFYIPKGCKRASKK